MGVNAQKRKKKQGPVPTLEESLPKRFKSDKSVKPKKHDGGEEANDTSKRTAKSHPKTSTKVENPKPVSEEVNALVAEKDDFGTTKASLFDDDEDMIADEFQGLEDEVSMYFPKCAGLNAGTKMRLRMTLFSEIARMEALAIKCSAISRMKKNSQPQTWKPSPPNSTILIVKI